MNLSTFTIPLFPLELVVFPGEEQLLHIYENRYKALISDSLENNTPFGIPYYRSGKEQSHGSLVRVTRILKRYPDGRMAIAVEGLQTFSVIGWFAQPSDDVYGTGFVEYHTHDFQSISFSFLDKFLSGFTPLTNQVLDPDAYEKSDLFTLVKKLPLTSEQKFRIIGAPDLKSREQASLKYLEFLLLLHKQEEKASGTYFPN
jgi:uncharacterized protein